MSAAIFVGGIAALVAYLARANDRGQAFDRRIAEYERRHNDTSGNCA